MMSSSDNLFHYDPNLTLTYVGAAAFGVASIFFAIQTIRFKAWYFIPFLIGCISEAAGYGARRVAADRVTELGPYIGQGLLLLLPPAFFSATIYMLLKKIIICMDGQSYSRLSLRWLTKAFVTADCFSLFLQAAGGGLQGSGKENMAKVGQWVTIFGLIVQVVAFSVFLYLTWSFQNALERDAASPAHRTPLRRTAPWQLCVYAIYASGVLILIRSVYRLIEYGMGHTGYLMTHEAYFYGLDTLPMFLTTLVFMAIFPPSLLRKQALIQGETLSEVHTTKEVV